MLKNKNLQSSLIMTTIALVGMLIFTACCGSDTKYDRYENRNRSGKSVDITWRVICSEDLLKFSDVIVEYTDANLQLITEKFSDSDFESYTIIDTIPIDNGFRYDTLSYRRYEKSIHFDKFNISPIMTVRYNAKEGVNANVNAKDYYLYHNLVANVKTSYEGVYIYNDVSMSINIGSYSTVQEYLDKLYEKPDSKTVIVDRKGLYTIKQN